MVGAALPGGLLDGKMVMLVVITIGNDGAVAAETRGCDGDGKEDKVFEGDNADEEFW